MVVEWIDVLVKEPNINQDVFCWNGVRSVAAKYVRRNVLNKNGEIEERGQFQIEKYHTEGDRSLVANWADVTHWMPLLPKP